MASSLVFSALGLTLAVASYLVIQKREREREKQQNELRGEAMTDEKKETPECKAKIHHVGELGHRFGGREPPR